MMGTRTSFRVLMLSLCLISCGCHSKLGLDKSPPFRIIATDAGFQAPDVVPAGLRHIVFENHGSQIHEAMLVKLPDGMTPDDYVAAVKAGSLFPKAAQDYSGPGLTSPGETVEVWVKIDPGNYVIICWNDGHAKSTPVHPFTVQYAISDDEPPKEDVVLKMIDYRFELNGTLRKGKQVLRIETPGPSMHEVDFFRLHDGKNVDDVNRWRKANGQGAPPVDALGGALDSHDIKRIVWLRRDFTPGRYVLHCEMPVTTDSQTTNQQITHADVGMVREIKIEE
jgi:Sulfocyanin (SoxE) domain